MKPAEAPFCCGSCHWWGEPGSREKFRPCLYPMPKWVRSHPLPGDQMEPCQTWRVRLPADNFPEAFTGQLP